MANDHAVNVNVEVRPPQWPQDIDAVDALDTTIVTEKIYEPVREAMSIKLVEREVSPPFTKRYPLDPSDARERVNWDYSVVAEIDGEVVGFAAAQYAGWNRRVILWHLYVAPHCRRQGIGAGLLVGVDEYARSTDARCLWLETQNTNYPAIQFYQRQGFRFCGFDESLYDPSTMSVEEIALFFTRDLSR